MIVTGQILKHKALKIINIPYKFANALSYKEIMIDNFYEDVKEKLITHELSHNSKPMKTQSIKPSDLPHFKEIELSGEFSHQEGDIIMISEAKIVECRSIKYL